MLKVVTINILFDLDRWSQRKHLLADGLAATDADVIGVQEVNFNKNTGTWLAKELNYPHVQLVPYDRFYPHLPPFGGAILSRYPFLREERLNLQGQGRYAQRVEIEKDGCAIALCSGHYYWQPGPHRDRVAQVQRLLDWLGELPETTPTVALGDFNGIPEDPAIALMQTRFASAYPAHNGREPDYTCPTPLFNPPWRRKLRLAWLNLIHNRRITPWRGTLDYIFVSHHWTVKACQLILNQPDRRDRTLYPSDHFGIFAELDLK
ncbi:MAG: endonuclease/exonuclease/phosphatase family protein [Spirulina sp.]